MYVTIDKLCEPLLSILTKLAKYDVGDGFLHTIKMLVSKQASCALFWYNHVMSLSYCVILLLFFYAW